MNRENNIYIVIKALCFFHQYSYQICLLQLLYSMCAKSGLRLNDEPDLKLSYVGQCLVFVFGVVHHSSTDLIVCELRSHFLCFTTECLLILSFPYDDALHKLGSIHSN